MVPTLYAVPQGGAAVQGPAPPAPFITASFGRAGSGTLVASTANFFADESQAPEGSAQTNAFALSSFLDLDTLANYNADRDAPQSFSIQPVSLGTGVLPSAGSDAGARFHAGHWRGAFLSWHASRTHGKPVRGYHVPGDLGPASTGPPVARENGDAPGSGHDGGFCLKLFLGRFWYLAGLGLFAGGSDQAEDLRGNDQRGTGQDPGAAGAVEPRACTAKTGTGPLNLEGPVPGDSFRHLVPRNSLFKNQASNYKRISNPTKLTIQVVDG